MEYDSQIESPKLSMMLTPQELQQVATGTKLGYVWNDDQSRAFFEIAVDPDEEGQATFVATSRDLLSKHTTYCLGGQIMPDEARSRFRGALLDVLRDLL